MKNKVILFATVGLLVFVMVSCLISELSWSVQVGKADSLREAVALPSVAIGNLNPSARNPGLEIFCTSLLDTPGGYCYYFTLGVPMVNFTIFANITKSEIK
jgi:hypothetical protein